MREVKKKFNNDILLSITKYIVEKYKITQPVKLQKMLYFLYLDYLKQTGEKLFDDDFEAWIYGPVLPKVFYYIKNYGFNFEIEEGTNFFEISDLSDNKTRKFIDKNIKKYLQLSSFDLVEMAHETEPWKNARKDLADNQISKNLINFSDLQNFAKEWKV